MSTSEMPKPPSPIARPIGVSFGNAISAPAPCSRARKLAGPTSASTSIAGRLSDICSALPRGHRALIAEIEIFRRIGAVARRPVEQDRLGMGEPLLEGERVDERFQRRARRARRARHVDRAVARGVGIVGRADAGANLAAGVVDRDDRRPRVSARAARRCSLASASSFACKRASIESLMTWALGSAATASSAACAASAGKSLRHCGIGSRLAASASSARDDAARGGAIEHARAGARARPRDTCRGGALPAPAAAPPAAPPRRSSAGAAPCRNRRAKRRARLRDCRRTAPASDSGRARRPC